MASISRGDSQKERTGVLLGKSKQHIISYHMLSLNTVKAIQRTLPPFFKGVPPGPQYNHNLKKTGFKMLYNTKLLVFGHRSLIKNKKQTAVIKILKTCIL